MDQIWPIFGEDILLLHKSVKVHFFGVSISIKNITCTAPHLALCYLPSVVHVKECISKQRLPVHPVPIPGPAVKNYSNQILSELNQPSYQEGCTPHNFHTVLL